MKKNFFLLFLLFPFFTFSQSVDERIVHDSLFFYQREVGRMMRHAQDSVKNSPRYIAYQEGIKRLKGKSQNYAGPVLVTGIQHSNFEDFNASIQQDGFEPMSATAWQAGFGISTKSQNVLLDMYFFVSGFSNTSYNGEEKISMTLSNVLQFDVGYDLIPSRPVSLYPYVGTSLRISTLDFDSPAQINSSYTNITNLIINDQSVETASFRLGYHVGLGFDLLLSTNEKRGTGKYLFIKAGLNRPVWRDKYKTHDIKYDPDIRQGNWVISFGIKFANFE